MHSAGHGISRMPVRTAASGRAVSNVARRHIHDTQHATLTAMTDHRMGGTLSCCGLTDGRAPRTPSTVLPSHGIEFEGHQIGRTVFLLRSSETSLFKATKVIPTGRPALLGGDIVHHTAE